MPDWPAFLDDFQRYWPTDEDIYVDFVRDGMMRNGAARMGNARWRRLTEERAGSAKSVFHFDVQGSVAKSTHAGLPWLRFIRQRLGFRIHFWPFDGWDIPVGHSGIAEVYPALCSRSFAREARDGDQHDAFSIAAWLSRAHRNGSLATLVKPDLTPPERTIADRGLDIGSSRLDSRGRGTQWFWVIRFCPNLTESENSIQAFPGRSGLAVRSNVWVKGTCPVTEMGRHCSAT